MLKMIVIQCRACTRKTVTARGQSMVGGKDGGREEGGEARMNTEDREAPDGALSVTRKWSVSGR